MNLITSNLLFSVVGALIRPGICLIMKRVLRVAPANHSVYKLSSNTGIRNYGICAKYCKSEECLSFSYTVDEKKCVTYSRFIEEILDADISRTTIYFSRVMSSCSDVPPLYHSGVYRMTTAGQNTLDLYCDMDTADGPWTVIHRRTKGDVDFYRKWADYKNGFGDLNGDFWIGNDNLHLLTNISRKLRVELQALDGTWGYAEYKNFQVAEETRNYALRVKGFSGNISFDGMAHSNGYPFSTIDREHDSSSLNCARYLRSGWWHNDCTRANLNGPYFTLAYTGLVSCAMRWSFFPDSQNEFYPLKEVTMMIQ